MFKLWEDAKRLCSSLLETKHKFVIDRRTWLRGEGYSFSRLLRTDGMRCCLGFYCQSLGVPDQDMLEVGQPCLLPLAAQKAYGILDSWLFMTHNVVSPNSMPSEDMLGIVRTNDKSMDEKLRETELKRLFAKNGIKAKFVN